MNAEHQFQQQIKRYYPQAQSFVIALSGGLDSCVLLDLFSQLRQHAPQYTVRAIHVHHGLSPNADHWVTFCQNLCAEHHIELQVQYVQVDGQQGIEASARLARYQAIKSCLSSNEVLVTAHHQGDQTETFLLALKRGSGIQGLRAMQIQSQLFAMPIFRPLLHCARKQLQDYAQQHSLHWIEDESNQDNRYDRNFLRNQILPSLRQRWSHFDQAVQRTAQHCFEQQQLINQLLAREFAKIYQKEGSLQVENFERYSSMEQRALLRMWLQEHQLNMPSLRQLEQIMQDVILAKKGANPQFQLQNQVLRRYQQRLILTPKFTDISHFQAPLLPKQPLILPDRLGTIQSAQQNDRLLIQWLPQEPAQNKIEIQLPLPMPTQEVQVRFQYSGQVRLKATEANKDIKKVWQQFNIPPWQRSRTPLIFYADKLQAALGVFTVQE